MSIESIDLIEIAWSGPYTAEEAITAAPNTNDFGLYQIYGTHPVHGPDSQLYIGMVQARKFKTRIKEHADNWFFWQPNGMTIYLGRIGSTVPMTKDRWPEWDDQIARAERLLISHCTPPYNSQFIVGPGEIKVPTLVVNHGRRHRLPLSISSIPFSSWYGDATWKPYEGE